MGLKPKNKGLANFYECCDLRKKVYLPLFYYKFKTYLGIFCHSDPKIKLFQFKIYIQKHLAQQYITKFMGGL